MFRRLVKMDEILAIVAFNALITMFLTGMTEALALAESLSSEKSASYYDYYDQGLIALYHQDYEKAILAFKRVIEIAPSHADAHYRLGSIYSVLGKWKEAVEMLEVAIRLDANYIEAYFRLGDACLTGAARSKEAISLLQKAIQLDPHHARAHRLLGIAYLRQNNTVSAMVELQEAIRLNPSDSEAHYTLALTHFNRGEISEAINRSKQLIEQDSYHAKAHFILGNCYLRIGKTEDGKKELKTFERLSQESEQLELLNRSLKNNPSNFDAWYQLGELQMQRGELRKAGFSFQKCIALNPNPKDTRGYETLGYIYIQLKEYNQALELNRKLVQLYPDEAQYRSNLGVVYLMMGRHLEAIEAFKAAIQLAPSEPSFHLNLSQAYEQAGQLTKAKEEYNLFKKLEAVNR